MRLLTVSVILLLVSISSSFGFECWQCSEQDKTVVGACDPDSNINDNNAKRLRKVECNKGIQSCSKAVLTGKDEADSVVSKGCSQPPSSRTYSKELEGKCTSSGEFIEALLGEVNSRNQNKFQELIMCECDDEELCNVGNVNFILNTGLVVVSLVATYFLK